MSNDQGILGSGLGMVARNKRYIVWFFLLNLILAGFGTTGYRESSHAILDHSLYAQRLTQSFDLGTYIDLLVRPEFGPMNSLNFPAVYFSLLFFLATALFLPGVLAGFASTYRLPREDFFRACGRNLWRFVRLIFASGVVMGIAAGILFAINSAIGKKATESTNEMLSFELNMAGLFVIFLIMTTLRICFDLAEADVVLNDQRAVRKSIGLAFRHTFGNLGRLLGSYIVTSVVAAVILVGGLWIWMRLVSPTSIFGAFLVSQFTLLLLLIPRFWQRGVAVAYWKQKMMIPVAVIAPIVATPVAEPTTPVVAITPSDTPAT